MAKPWLVIAHEASNSGAPRMLVDLLRGVRGVLGDNWSCEILLDRGGPLVSELSQLGHVRRLSHPWAEGTGSIARCVRRLVDQPWLKPRRLYRWTNDWRARGGSLIFSNTATNGRLLAALPAHSGSVVSYVHELEYSLKRFNRSVDLEHTITRTDFFLAVSSAVSHDLEALGIEPRRIKRFPNFLLKMPAKPACDKAKARICHQLGLTYKTRLVVGCGYIDYLKGVDLFVEMAGLVAKRLVGPIAFLWLGGEHDRQYARKIRASLVQLESGVVIRFLGEVPDVVPYFEASEIVVVASRVESFSRVALEAGALGKPVLGYASARGIADLLEPKSLVGETSAEAMAISVVQALTNPERAFECGERLRLRIQEGFTADRWTPELISMMQEVGGA